MAESEKYAKELIEEYKHIILGETLDGDIYYMETFEAKECAKITVKRIIAANPTSIVGNSKIDFFNKVLTAIDKI